MSTPYSNSENKFGRHSADAFASAPAPVEDEASYYSRDRYGSGAHADASRKAPTHIPSQEYPADGLDYINASEIYPEIARLRKKKKRRKRIVLIIACLLVACLGATAAYAFWFIDRLDSALAPDEIEQVSLEGILEAEVPGEPFYVLLMGSDSREGNEVEHHDEAGDNERSDVMMLVRIDATEKQVTLLSIPRDTPYRLEDGSYIKINEMFNEKGTAGAVEAVSNLTGLPIMHYAEAKISGLEAIVDLLGGVTVDVPTELSYETTDKEQITIPEGTQTLNGREAQIFARARHEFEGNQDEHRQNNVRQLLSAIIKKILDRPISEIPNIALQIAEYVDTDYKTLSIVSLAMTFADGDMTIYSATGPTNGDNNEAAYNKWMCFLNPEGWEAVVEAVDAGEDPSGIDYSETEIPWTEVTDQPDFDTSLAHKYYYGV